MGYRGYQTAYQWQKRSWKVDVLQGVVVCRHIAQEGNGASVLPPNLFPKHKQCIQWSTLQD